MKIVKTEQGGLDLTLDDSLLLGRGMEGAVYRVPGDDSLLVKIYWEKVEDELANKLRVMVANPPDDPMRDKGHASIAWPKDLVLGQNQEICGFVMPRLRDGHAISRFYDLATRRVQLPFFTYKSLCLLGSNLASAVWALHDKGYVIGDVNEGNIMADNNALVTIVDTDSFQIREASSGIVYRCTVYTPLYTPPELQKVSSFDQVDRAPEHDLFGIGVLLFQLLMEGQLPFACAFSNPDQAVDAVECLKRGYFPYAQSSNGISPPPVAPPYAMLHPTLQKLFKRCFVDGHKSPALRPTAKEWHQALRYTAHALNKCAANAQHYYFSHLQNCPWCERARLFNAGKRRGNWDPFPQPGTVSVPTGSRGGRSGSQRPISAQPVRPVVTPPAPPAPVVFTASATSIAPGQSITFQWTVPNAHTVQLKERSGRVVATSNSPSGSATVWLTRNQTYQLSAAGVTVVMPAPITISVAQPAPVALKEIAVELKAPIALHSAQLALRKTLQLKQAVVPLISPMRLKEHMRLDGYQPLHDVTVELNYAVPAS